tara:strand:+ start:205 stop:456 length:252 start_codon:yes stop_codon:yes gene_type:complete
VSESTNRETREQATVRILSKAKPATKYPVKRNNPDVEIGVLRKGGNTFFLTKDENIFLGAKEGCLTIDYSSLEDVMNDGWLID